MNLYETQIAEDFLAAAAQTMRDGQGISIQASLRDADIALNQLRVMFAVCPQEIMNEDVLAEVSRLARVLEGVGYRIKCKAESLRASLPEPLP
jgi:hypothetical protein